MFLKFVSPLQVVFGMHMTSCPCTSSKPMLLLETCAPPPTNRNSLKLASLEMGSKFPT